MRTKTLIGAAMEGIGREVRGQTVDEWQFLEGDNPVLTMVFSNGLVLELRWSLLPPKVSVIWPPEGEASEPDPAIPAVGE